MCDCAPPSATCESKVRAQCAGIISLCTAPKYFSSAALAFAPGNGLGRVDRARARPNLRDHVPRRGRGKCMLVRRQVLSSSASLLQSRIGGGCSFSSGRTEIIGSSKTYSGCFSRPWEGTRRARTIPFSHRALVCTMLLHGRVMAVKMLPLRTTAPKFAHCIDSLPSRRTLAACLRLAMWAVTTTRTRSAWTKAFLRTWR